MSLPGDYNGWDLTAQMTKTETAANTVNHVWMADVKLDSEGGVKFNSGEKYWGGVTFPYGVATEKDGNIPATPGTYKVFFNDITGGYYFFAKK